MFTRETKNMLQHLKLAFLFRWVAGNHSKDHSTYQCYVVLISAKILQLDSAKIL